VTVGQEEQHRAIRRRFDCGGRRQDISHVDALPGRIAGKFLE